MAPAKAVPAKEVPTVGPVAAASALGTWGHQNTCTASITGACPCARRTSLPTAALQKAPTLRTSEVRVAASASRGRGRGGDADEESRRRRGGC